MARDRFINDALSERQGVNCIPIYGYQYLSVLTLEEATNEIKPMVPDVADHVSKAKKNCNQNSTVLTQDESAAIYLYSMPIAFFSRLNEALRTEDRDALKPWFAFLKLFITALEKLPSTKKTIWRVVNGDVRSMFVGNDVRTWWSVNSCSMALNVVEAYVGEMGTVFLIDAVNAKDISAFSIFQEEQEVILMPGTRVRAKCKPLNFKNHFFIVSLEEETFQRMNHDDGRCNQDIVKDLCSFDPTSTLSSFRLPHDCYVISIGRLTSEEHLNKLTKTVQDTKTSNEEATNFKFTMMETEEMEYFLEHVTLDNKAAIEKLADDRRHCFVYEDHFNPALFDMVEQKASFQQLKDVCRRYESKRGVNVDNIMAEHEKRTASSTPYFVSKGLSTNSAQGAAFALSFYTGTKSEAISRGASLVARQANGQVMEEKTKDEMNEAAVILFYLVKALSYIPYYWGYVTRACQLTDPELKLYMPGCLITWIQFSSSKKGKEAATTSNFANRNTFFKIYSLTGRRIKQFSNYDEEDEVLFLPHSTFFVFKHELSFHGTQHTIYMRQVELGLSQWSVLWVDDRIFKKKWENKGHMESAAARALNLNVHFIPKSSTESALSFLRSPFGQRLKNKDTFRIVTDMNRKNENPIYNAGARLIKQLRELGFENECLVFTSDQKNGEMKIQSELNSKEQKLVYVTTRIDDLRKFINFEK